MTTDAHLAIVVCTYNRSASLLETLYSLYSCGFHGPQKVDILVVANNCHDDTLSRLAAFKSANENNSLFLNWVEEKKAGKSYALNAAIKFTQHDALCFIDDDQIVEAGFIEQLIIGLNAYPDEAIYCGRIWPNWDGSEPEWVHIEGKYAIPIRPFPEFDLGNESKKIPSHDRYPSGGNIVVRRKVFEAIGGFSVELGPTGHNLAGGEDHDFLRRATAKGFGIRYLPGMRQLHAIDAERMSTSYTLKKSLQRSRSNILIRGQIKKPHLYMFRKVLEHMLSSLFTLDADRRYFFQVRLAASLGELLGSFDALRDSKASKLTLPMDRNSVLVAVLTVIIVGCGVVAWYFSKEFGWMQILPTLAAAGLGSSALLVKSLRDFSQTGPTIRQEVLNHYRYYTVYALSRLEIWLFIIFVYLGAAGALLGYLFSRAIGYEWDAWSAFAFSLVGIVMGLMIQFVRKLRYNPGLLVTSMHYRTSRLYRIWHYFTPSRIAIIEAVMFVGVLTLFMVVGLQLKEMGQTDVLVPLAAMGMFFISTIYLISWEPDARRVRSFDSRKQTLPNIIMVGSDTLRSDRLGGMGYHRVLTPNIDTLVKQGVHFSNCYVPCARTAPSLISLLTGTWPHTHGVRDNFVVEQEAQLAVDALPKQLKKMGYQSAAISDWCGADLGKFSFGFDCVDLPEDQWNIKYLIRQGPKDMRLFISLFTHNRLGRWFLPEIYYLGGVPLTQSLGKRARSMVSRLAESDSPFFLNVFYSTTHPPFASEWPWYTRFADSGYVGESKFAMARLTDPFEIIRRQGAPREEFDLDQIIDLYDGCVAQFDDEVGKMLAHIEVCGLTYNTIVVVYSDHGMEFFEHDTWGQGNSAVGEASPRIPLVIRDPRREGVGSVKNVVRSIDLAPTLLELVGAPSTGMMDGVSLVGCLDMADCPELDAFNETGIWIGDIPGMPSDHLRYPDLMELLEVPDKGLGTLGLKPGYLNNIIDAKDRMLRSGKWKLVYQPLQNGSKFSLFDLENDPQCENDISDKYPSQVHDLREKLNSLLVN